MKSSARWSALAVLSSLVWVPPVVAAPGKAPVDRYTAPVENSSVVESATVTWAPTPDVGRPEGTVSELKRDVRMMTQPGAAATASYTTMLPVGIRAAKVPIQAVKVEAGRVDVVVPDGGPQKGAMLQGPHEILGISTSGRLAMVLSEDEIVLAALEGKVLVGQRGRFKTIQSGTLIRFDRKGGQELGAAPLPSAPSLALRSRMAPTIGGPASIQVTARADSSRLRTIVFDQKGEAIDVFEGDADKPIEVALPGPGSYRIASRALDASGIGGPLSEPVQVEVLGVTPGDHAQHRGVYLLNPGQRLSLVGTEGLQMRYGGGGPFVRAGTSIGLKEDKDTVVQFRDPKAPEEIAMLRLAPRIAQAKIEIGPGLAVWPKDPVEMSVSLQDGVGRVIPIDESFVVRVRVNLDDVEVAWTEEDGQLKAVLPPRQGQGPWVVRVSVRDEHDRVVGRNHLEVVRRDPPPPRERQASR